jgi:hypothetical protein
MNATKYLWRRWANAGLLLLIMAVFCWKTMSSGGHIFFLIATPAVFAVAFYFLLRGVGKRNAVEAESSPHRNFFREYNGWKSLFGGVLLLLLGLSFWKNMNMLGSLLTFGGSAFGFAHTLYCWRIVANKRRKHRRVQEPLPEPESNKRNPLAELPPLKK